MPGRNGMGPIGNGPKTGRRMGFCAGAMHTSAQFVAGYGFGGGHGHRNRFCQNGIPRRMYEQPANVVSDLELEKQSLKQQAQEVENQLTQIQDRLKELESHLK